MKQEEFAGLRNRAVALRRAGRSRRQIADELGIATNWVLGELLRGEPPPEWTARPNAKDGLRDTARAMRRKGRTYNDIAGELGVSKASVSLWVRDITTPALEERLEDRKAARVARTEEVWWKPERRRRSIERQQTKFAAAQDIGDLTHRELLMAGALVYWCEGAKDKPYRRSEHVSFINSDPVLIALFLRFLWGAGVQRSRLRFRVHIHETANLDAATRYWADIAEAEPASFQRPVIKHHRPRTNRHNLSDQYRGCLEVRVLRSAGLYRRIEGWAYAAMTAVLRVGSSTGSIGSNQGEVPIPDTLAHSRAESAGRLQWGRVANG